MYCQTCGMEVASTYKLCPKCGNKDFGIPPSSQIHSKPIGSLGTTPVEMTFARSISTCMAKYADFKGRATRPEYWWFYLFCLLLGWGAVLVDPTGIGSIILNLAIFLPTLSVSVRRLHDTNHSGWWFLIAFTVIGLIPLIYWFASKGDEQANQYGAVA